MIQQQRKNLIAVWLGLFALLMIHAGPFISGAQALQDNATVTTALLTVDEHSMQSIAEHIADAEHGIDYHALMGHHSVPDGRPQWLVNLDMCGYCDLLTLSPPLLISFFLALAVPPRVLWLTVLPTPLQLQTAAHSLSHSRAPPRPLFV